MKRIKLLLLAAIAFTCIQASAQTVDEIVSKNVEAMGGKEKLAALKSVKMSGSMSVQGTDITITTTRAQNIGMRTDIEVMGTSNYQMVNATKGWVFMPIQQMDAPREMTDDEYKMYAGQMDVQGALFNYKDKGHTVELVGTEKVDGKEAYNLKITLKNGRVVNYFIDKATNRLVKSTGKVSVQGEEHETSTTYSDYKQTADGYWFPYTITSMQGPVTFDKIETNVPVDEKIFSN